MSAYYVFPACEEGRHVDCERNRAPATPDGYDGARCSCACHRRGVVLPGEQVGTPREAVEMGE